MSEPSPFIEDEADSGEEAEENFDIDLEDVEDLGSASEVDVPSILAQNPEKAAKVKGYLSGDFRQSVEKIASLAGSKGDRGKRSAGKPPASAYADVVKKKRRRSSDDEDEPRTKKEERSKEEYGALKKDLIDHYARTQGKKWKGSIGGGQGGKFAKGATVKSAARDYTGERGKQLLHQICVRLYDFALYEARAKPTEVQALFVRNRMVFAANEDLAVKVLRSIKAQAHDSLLALLTEPPVQRSKEHEQIEFARYQDMFNAHQVAVELADDQEEYDSDGRVVHIFDDAPQDDEELLDQMFDSLLYGSRSDSWSGGNVGEAVAWLQRDDTERGVFWCDPSDLGGDIHAEQALAIVLLRACRDEKATITGTMRPCVGCYLTLLYGVRKLGLKISEPQHPGGFWKGTQVDGFIAMIDARQLMFAQIHDAVIKAADEEEQEDAPAEGRAAEEFQQFVSKEFPAKTYATAYLEGQSGSSEVGPATHFRRTFTRSESDFAEMAEWSKKQQAQPKKVASKKKAADDDDDEYVDEEESELPKKKAPGRKPEPKASARRQHGRKPPPRDRDRARDGEGDDESEENY